MRTALATKPAQTLRSVTAPARNHLTAMHRAQDRYFDKLKRAERDYFDAVRRITAAFTAEVAPEPAPVLTPVPDVS